MARDILDAAPFLSPTAPSENVVDYSGRLGKQDQALETFVHSLSFESKVVILPSDFSPGSMSAFDSFCRSLAQKWHVSGERFILVVDLKGRHVRGLSGNTLQNEGVDSSFISLLVKDQFIPYMKRDQLSEAIRHTLAGVQAKITESKANFAQTQIDANPISSTRVPQDLSTEPSGINLVNAGYLGFFVLIAMLIAFTVLTIWLQKSKRNKRISNQSQKLFDAVKLRLATLYERADLIGQAAEFLKPTDNADLAKDVAEFFNRVGALSATQNKLEAMKRKGNLSESYEQLRKMEKMLDLLEPESDKLLASVNLATGGSARISESPEAVALKFERDAELAVQKDKDREEMQQNAEIRRRNEEERFRRPSWSYEPTYYQPIVHSDPWASLSNWMVMLNQMQLEDRMDRMNDQISQMERGRSEYGRGASNSSTGDGGGSWGGNNSNDSAWADSGGDSGSWDSGGDSSGSWDGGGDAGGGDGGGSW